MTTYLAPLHSSLYRPWKGAERNRNTYNYIPISILPLTYLVTSSRAVSSRSKTLYYRYIAKIEYFP